MDNISLEILTPEKLMINDNVESVTVPGTKGSFQVLKDHAPLMSTLDIGVITIKKNNEKSYFSTGGGSIEVLKNKVNILADSLENVEDIDVDRAEKAKERAEERLSKKSDPDFNEERAEAALKRAINRLSAKKKYM
jgi:F-type H+-transporting ATPase subunit epsilon